MEAHRERASSVERTFVAHQKSGKVICGVTLSSELVSVRMASAALPFVGAKDLEHRVVTSKLAGQRRCDGLVRRLQGKLQRPLQVEEIVEVLLDHSIACTRNHELVRIAFVSIT